MSLCVCVCVCVHIDVYATETEVLFCDVSLSKNCLLKVYSYKFNTLINKNILSLIFLTIDTILRLFV